LVVFVGPSVAVERLQAVVGASLAVVGAATKQAAPSGARSEIVRIFIGSGGKRESQKIENNVSLV